MLACCVTSSAVFLAQEPEQLSSGSGSNNKLTNFLDQDSSNIVNLDEVATGKLLHDEIVMTDYKYFKGKCHHVHDEEHEDPVKDEKLLDDENTTNGDCARKSTKEPSCIAYQYNFNDKTCRSWNV